MPARRGRERGGLPGAGAGADRPSPVATVERAGQAILVRPPCEAALRPLRTALHVAAVHAKRGFLTVPWPAPLYRVEDAPRGRQAIMPAGLEPVAVALLERAGISVVREGEPAAPLAMPAEVPRLVDPALVAFVNAKDRGRIRVGPGVRPEALVAQLRPAFPEAAIAVAAIRREDVRRFGRALRTLVPSACWSLGDDFPADPGPLVASTYLGLADHGVALHRRDILICLDAREALGRDACLAIGHADRARLFGLVGRDECLAPYDRDRIWGVFGFDALDVPRHGHVARPVEVVTLRVTGGPAVAPDDDGVALRRKAVWRNPVRNRRIARLADVLARGDSARVAAESPALAARPAGAVVPRVIVLVEGVEHALELAALLPGWPVLTGPDVATAGLPSRRLGILAGRRRDGGERPGRAIATLVGMGRIDLARVDVVVRADGGTGVPTVLAAGLSLPYPVVSPLLLVDLDDRHHPGLRRLSRGRRRAYLDLGWAVGGVAAPASPLDVFLATRPGRRP